MRSSARRALLTALLLGMVAAMLPLSGAAANGSVHINEIQVSTSGTDWEFFELQGAPGTDLSAYTLVGVESDNFSGAGTIDRAISLSGESIPGDGFWVAMSPAAVAAYSTTPDASIGDNTFENSTATYFLVSGFTGSVGDDLDTDNDGTLDATPWTAVADSLNIRDSGSGDHTYGAAESVGPDGPFLPSGAYRCPDAPAGTFDDNIHNFSSPDGTPGVSNGCAPSVPIPVFIHDVQGSGSSSPIDGVDVIVEGVVVGDFQGTTFTGNQLGGFFLQEEDGDHDADPLTSEGIFVFAPSAPDVVPGDVVKVTGTVDEFGGLTEVTDVTDVEITGSSSFSTVGVSLPAPTSDFWERYEGMHVVFTQDLYISEYFNFDRFGEIVLTSARQFQPTQLHEPGSGAAAALADANALDRITLDDGRTSQNPDPALHPNGAEFTLTNRFRGGDILEGVTGALSEAFGRYRIQPTAGATHVVDNPRPTNRPHLPGEGQLRVASFNVLNFFTSIDDGSDDCGPTGNLECRGADDATELQRQLDKLAAGIVGLGADIVGIQEIENDIRDDDGSRAHDAVLTLVEELNAVEGAGTWAWVGEADHYNDYPVRNDLIYRTASVTPVGDAMALAHSAFDQTRPGDIEPVGRPPLAQTFTTDDDSSDRGNRRAFTVVVNHFKSKGSSCSSIGDPDTGGGSGNCNLTRLAQSEALMGWVPTLQATSGDDDVLLIGDFNSYAQEDPIDRIEEGPDGVAGNGDDFTGVLEAFQGLGAYTFVFDGQLGALDHALASSSLVSQVRGAVTWKINVDEPDIFDYDTSFKKPAQDALYEPLPYRASDHDPVIVAIKLERQD